MKLKSTLTLLIASFALIAFFQVLSLFIAYRFPKIEAGFFFALFSFCKVVNLLTDFGTTTYYKRESAMSSASVGGMNAVIVARFILSFLIISFLSLLVCLYYGKSFFFIVLIFLYHLFEHYNNFLIGLLQAKSLFKEQMISISLFIITTLSLFAISFLFFNISLVSIIIILISGGIVQSLYLLKKAKVFIVKADFNRLFLDLKRSFHIGLFEVVNSLAPRLIPIILYKNHASLVGAYSLVNMVVTGLILLPTCLFAAFYTDVIGYIELKDKKQVIMYKKANLFFFVSGFSASILLLLEFSDVLTFLVGNKYAVDLKTINFLFLIIPFTFINNFHNSLLLAFGCNQTVMRLNFFHFLCATILFIVMLNFNGVKEALLSYILTELLFSMLRYKTVQSIIKRNMPAVLVAT